MEKELYQLLLDEIRGTKEKVEDLKDFVDDKIEKAEGRMTAKIDRVEDECGRLEAAQAAASVEHARMNTLLDEHIRGVRAAEARLEKLENDRIPPLELDLQKRKILKEGSKFWDENTTRKAKKWAAVIGVPIAIITLITGIVKFLDM